MPKEISQVQFEELKAFVLRNEIPSCIATLDKPVVPFDYSRNPLIGENFRIVGMVSPFLFNAVGGQRAVVFSSENYNPEYGLITVKGQDFKPTEVQLKRIMKDDFGAVISHCGWYNFLTKEEYLHNEQITKDKELSNQFADEVRRLEKLMEIEKNFNEIKANAEENLVGHLLDKWEKPIFPLVKPQDSGRIQIVGGYGNSYGRVIGEGCEISFDEHFNSESGYIEVADNRFKPTQEQFDTLKNDGVAYLSEKNGFTVFHSKNQIAAMQEYVANQKAYSEFNDALQEVVRIIKMNKYVAECAEQHERLSALPFPYYVAIKVNVRLLTENRWGDGAKKNTVHHIVPEVALTGRLKREANEFLCGGNSSYGSPSKEHDAIYAGSSEVMCDVTCKRCLELAEKMLGNAKKTA